jgi:hypothetical protein
VSQLRQAVRGIEVNAAVGRSFGVGVEILTQRQNEGLLPDAVVIGLGDNGWVTTDQIDQAMHVLRDASVIALVNLKEPRSWEAHDNAMVADAARRYPNVVVVDWHDASANHPEYFWDDGIHLRPDGAAAYAHLIAAALTRVPVATLKPQASGLASPSIAGGASQSAGASGSAGIPPPAGASPRMEAPASSKPSQTAAATPASAVGSSPSAGP